ncbi:MAG: polymer-forming cytoskeletal protein [Chitinophagaceae bacterium]|nr:polymer-forming cytoskeletal protein [Chitinophagaceae bacterium]
MFNGKSKSDIPQVQGNSTSLIGAGTTFKGDITSNADLRIDGILTGNIFSTAKIIIGANGSVQGDISGQQADIHGKVVGTIKVKDLLQLKGTSIVNGNIHAGNLQIDTSATFNGQCQMTPLEAATERTTAKEEKPVKVMENQNHVALAK